MLAEILRAHNGRLPDDIAVVFANTGAEAEETLRFVHRFSEAYEVPIAWVEYDWDAPHRTRRVTFETASRRCEPYERLIDRKGFVPNATLRFCTSYLKREPIGAYARYALGWAGWHSVVGLRGDEPKRARKFMARNCGSETGEWGVLPMWDSGVTEAQVQAYWADQPFDLEIAQGEGNCTFCFLKSRRKLLYLMVRYPERARWWIEQERKVRHRTNESGEKVDSLKRFREHETYEQLFDVAMRQGDMYLDDTEEDEIECLCTD